MSTGKAVFLYEVCQEDQNMKYISKNSLSDFEFHDAELSFESFIDNCLTVKALHLNIHKDADQNPFETDMAIASAHLSFEECVIRSYQDIQAYRVDENGHQYACDEPKPVYSGDEGQKRFMDKLKEGITIFDFGKIDESTFYLDVSSAPVFTIRFSFKNVSIEWNDFEGPAWYTL